MDVDLSPNTLRAYRSDWADFVAWCEPRRRRTLPATPSTVAAYVTWSGEQHRPATVHRRLAAIAFEHRRAGLAVPCAHPLVRSADAMVGWRGREQRRASVPVSIDDVLGLVGGLDESVAAIRDRALILVMFGTGLRRTEVAVLDLADVALRGRSLRVSVPGRPEIVVPLGSRPALCAVTAWRAWIAARSERVPDGLPVPAFCPVDRCGRLGERHLSGRSVARILARATERAGMEPGRITTRSLRSGLVLVAASKGIADDTIMRQSGHRQTRRVRELTRIGRVPPTHSQICAKLRTG